MDENRSPCRAGRARRGPGRAWLCPGAGAGAGLAERPDPHRRALPAGRHRPTPSRGCCSRTCRPSSACRWWSRTAPAPRARSAPPRSRARRRTANLGAGLRHPCGEPGADPEHGLRHPARPDAAAAVRHRAHGADRSSHAAPLAQRRGGGRGGEGAAGHHHLRHHRQWQPGAPDHDAGCRGPADFSLVHVPYRGGGPLAIAAVAGEVDLPIATAPGLGAAYRFRRARPAGADRRRRARPRMPDTPDAGGIRHPGDRCARLLGLPRRRPTCRPPSCSAWSRRCARRSTSPTCANA